MVSCVFLANFSLACVTKLWVKKPKAAPKIAKKKNKAKAKVFFTLSLLPERIEQLVKACYMKLEKGMTLLSFYTFTSDASSSLHPKQGPQSFQLVEIWAIRR